MKTSTHTWVRALVIFGLLMALLASAATAFAELTEAEKKALEEEQKAAEEANEPPEDQQIQDQEPPANEPPAPAEDPEPPAPPEPAEDPEPPAPPEPAEDPEPPAPPEPAEDPEPPAPPEPAEDPEPPAPPEPAEAPEPPQAPEPPGGGPDTGQGNPPTTGNLSGYISAIGTDTISVGITGDNTVNVTPQTYITRNGQLSNLIRLLIGDAVSLKYDVASDSATHIEAEGYSPFLHSTRLSVSTVRYVGLVGHIPGRFLAFIAADGHAMKIGPDTEVAINGVAASYMDIEVGDTVDYAQSRVDGKALWVKLTKANAQ